MTTRIGPFWAARHRFFIDANDESLLADLDDRLRDLRRRPPSDEVVDGESADTWEFRIERTGPRWMSHPWALWRDGEACEQTVTDEYIVPYVLWEVTRLVLEGAELPVVPMHAAALVHRQHSIALIGPSHSGKSTLAGWLTRSGWGFLTDEVALLDTSDPTDLIVHPFWRPIGVRRPGPLDEYIGEDGEDSEVLVPASSLGTLGTPAPLVALVCPTYEAGSAGTLEPLAPAAALTMIADQLPSLGRDGGEVFQRLAAVVAEVPAFTMLVDDLDAATRNLVDLVDQRLAVAMSAAEPGT